MAGRSNLVHETTTSTGTGNLTLARSGGEQTFNEAFSNGVTTNVFTYFIWNTTAVAAEWELGTGHMSDATTLVRDTVILSSNANALVNFGSGTKHVVNDIEAANQIRYGFTSTTPDLPVVNDKWLDSNTGVEYTRVATASSSSWVEWGVGGTVAALNSFDCPINLGLAASASASALTITLVTADGSTPSAASPVLIPFNNATATTGTPSVLSVTSATTLVVSSGSTLGVTSSTAFRLWVVGFNDSGTFRLGVINCSTSSTTASRIHPLSEAGLASATAEGGAGAADSAGVIYATTTITSKPFRILGFLEWSSSGLTAGTWTTTNLNYIRIFGQGLAKPGDVVQTLSSIIVSDFTTTSTTYVVATGFNGTLPIVSAANIIRAEFSGTIYKSSGTGSTRIHFSRGTTNNTDLVGSEGFVSAQGATVTGANSHIVAYDKPNVTGNQTYAVQILSVSSSNTSGVGNTDDAILNLIELMG